MNTKELIKRLLPALLMIVVLAVFLLPGKLEERKANQFGEPLFSHTLPEGAELIQQDAGKTDDGSVMAAMILKTKMSSEELEAFYGDISYTPAEEGQAVTLNASPLDESSLAALKQAKLYEEGAVYQFVFLTSK